MSLLKRIQDSTLDKDCDLATLLRLCKVFAAQAAAPELTEWVEHELNGYPNNVPLPDYRCLRVTSKGHFSGAFGSGLRYADIPVQNLPKEFREKYRQAAITQSIGSLQATVEGTSEGTLTLPWPTEAVQLFGADMYQNMHCIQAWKVLSVGSLRGILDAVKTRVLDFTLVLQKLHPELMSPANLDSKLASPQELQQTFNTTIYGSVGAIANASHGVAQHVTINQGDKVTLDRELASHGVPVDGVTELHAAIKADTAGGRARREGFGPKVKEWLGTAVLKVSSGLWNTTLETAGKVLPPLIAGYLGIELK
jgi:hypothetical protein